MRAQRDETADAVASFQQGNSYQLGSEDDAEAADRVFVALSEGGNVLDDPHSRLLAAELTARGALPETAQRQILAGIRSNDPEQMQEALQFAQGLRDVNPVATTGNKPIDDAVVGFEAFIALGDTPDQAVQRMIEESDPVLSAQRSIDRSANDVIVREVTANDVENVLDTAGTRQPDLGLTDAMRGSALAEYRAILRSELDRGVGEDVARARADGRFRRLYGVTRLFGSPTVMKFPPEAMYPAVAGSHDWLKEQLDSEVTEVMGGEVPGDIILAPVPMTQRDVEAGRSPRYQVQIIEERDGVLYIETPDMPLWFADPTAAIEAANSQAQDDFSRVRKGIADRQQAQRDFAAQNSAARPGRNVFTGGE
jgi:hypothetical protein